MLIELMYDVSSVSKENFNKAQTRDAFARN